MIDIDKNIFRAYDIRGIYPENVNEEMAYILGQSFGTYVSKNTKEVIIGYDNRLSSKPLSEALIHGLISTGMKVINLGLVTTPMLYFARFHLNKWAAIMITASHNPKEYNGFKISFDNKGNAVGDEIFDFRDFTLAGNFISNPNGSEESYDIKEEYLCLYKKSLNFGNRKIRIVVDVMNGTGATIIKDIMDLLEVEYELLYNTSDGTFPNHHPDPSVAKNLIDLQNKVKELHYDMGFAIDADGDRVAIVDEQGNIIATDLYMVIMYRYLNNLLKNRTSLYDVKCSRALIDELDKLNIKQNMSRVGNSYFYRKIHEEQIDFGGELSGHLYFNDRWPGFDSGIYAGLRMAELLSHTDKPLSALLEGMNQYFSTEENKIEVTDESKFTILDKLKKYLDENNIQYIDIDGVRIELEDGWGLIRVSNTGPHLTTRYEASSKERLIQIQNQLTDILNKVIN